MNVIVYVAAFAAISMAVALIGFICESNLISSAFSKVKTYGKTAVKAVLFVLMIPAFLMFRAASFVGLDQRD